MAAVKSEIATFFEVFPNGIVWGNTVRGEGYDIVLLGTGRADAHRRRRAGAAARQPGVRRGGALAARDRLRLGDGAAATYGGRGQDLRPWLQDAEINRDNNLRLQFLAGFGVDRDQRMEIYRGIVGYRRFPDDMFVGSPSTLAPAAGVTVGAIAVAAPPSPRRPSLGARFDLDDACLVPPHAGRRLNTRVAW